MPINIFIFPQTYVKVTGRRAPFSADTVERTVRTSFLIRLIVGMLNKAR